MSCLCHPPADGSPPEDDLFAPHGHRHTLAKSYIGTIPAARPSPKPSCPTSDLLERMTDVLNASDQSLGLPQQDDEGYGSTGSAASSATNNSAPFVNVDQEELIDSLADGEDSGNESDNPSDKFPTSMEAPIFTAPRLEVSARKDPTHQSFRTRRKKEMRHESFTYKQVSDEATPTAHRKQLFSKRSMCRLTQSAKEEVANGRHLSVNDYHFLKTLGKGAYGEVRLATKDLVEDDFGDEHTSRYAIKVMKRSMFEEQRVLPYRGRRHTADDVVNDKGSKSGSIEESNIPSALLQEINIMKRLAHPNLVKLKEIINDEKSKYLFLVLEHIQGGTVLIHNEKSGKYVYALTKTVMLESTARRLFKELASALSYLHANHIAHRDIKPDNLLITLEGKLKLSDFGVSTHFENDRRKHSISMKSLARSTSRGVVSKTEGTFAFYSPEMCSTSHAHKGKGYNTYMADLWAAGICLWIFIFGTVPYESKDVTELFRMIREDHPVRPHRVSPELDNLLGLMMRKDVSRRPSCMDVRHHCWVTEVPLAQHGEVVVHGLDDPPVHTDLPDLPEETEAPSSLAQQGVLTRSKARVERQSSATFVMTAENPTNRFSPVIKARLRAWLQHARKVCHSRHRSFVVKAQTQMNALIRKAAERLKETIKEEGESDDSSYFSMGSNNSDEEEDGEESVVFVSRSYDMIKDEGGLFGGQDSESDSDGDEEERWALQPRLSGSSRPVSAPAKSSEERNIFQRGLHKLEKRLHSLKTDDSRGSLASEEDGPSDSPRKSLVQRGLHKVAKRLSKSGPNKDRHLQEASRSEEAGGQSDGEGERKSGKVLGWFKKPSSP